MATLPYFVLSPSTMLSMAGLLRGRGETTPPAQNWKDATIDMVIPARNEANHIVLGLDSVLRQTLRPRRIVLVDDGSTDRTVEIAEAFCSFHGIELKTIRRDTSIGKTPTIKSQARELDGDVLFVLDGDTLLESPDYIERTVQALYQGVGVASAFGKVTPQRQRDRREVQQGTAIDAFSKSHPTHGCRTTPLLQHVARGVTNVYRDVLYAFLQCFVYRGQMAMYGTTTNPVGCAVAYRRRYLVDLFDHIDPILGDDLTNSEDIFIGFAMLNEGYRNAQVLEAKAQTVEPEIHRLHRQVYLWSSSFLQACYYFDDLLRSPFKSFKRRRHQRSTGPGTRVQSRKVVPAPAPAYAASRMSMLALPAAGTLKLFGGFAQLRSVEATAREIPRNIQIGPDGGWSSSRERRLIREPYRQPFGRARTKEFGRPAGWILLMSAIEKVFFPTALIIMLILRNWEGLWLTVVIESAFSLVALALTMKGARIGYVLKGIAVTPIRYGLLVTDAFTIARFASDLWVTRSRRWRK